MKHFQFHFTAVSSDGKHHRIINITETVSETREKLYHYHSVDLFWTGLL